MSDEMHPMPVNIYIYNLLADKTDPCEIVKPYKNSILFIKTFLKYIINNNDVAVYI